jgi:hypothetical protein
MIYLSELAMSDAITSKRFSVDIPGVGIRSVEFTKQVFEIGDGRAFYDKTIMVHSNGRLVPLIDPSTPDADLPDCVLLTGCSGPLRNKTIKVTRLKN